MMTCVLGHFACGLFWFEDTSLSNQHMGTEQYRIFVPWLNLHAARYGSLLRFVQSNDGVKMWLQAYL